MPNTIGHHRLVNRHRDEGGQPVSQGVSLLSGKGFAMRGDPNAVPTRPSDHQDGFQRQSPQDGGLASILNGRGYNRS